MILDMESETSFYLPFGICHLIFEESLVVCHVTYFGGSYSLSLSVTHNQALFPPLTL